MLYILSRLLIPTETRYLGRWAIKHEPEKCDTYMQKLHADPGYIDPIRKIMLEILDEKEKEKKQKGLIITINDFVKSSY